MQGLGFDLIAVSPSRNIDMVFGGGKTRPACVRVHVILRTRFVEYSSPASLHDRFKLDDVNHSATIYLLLNSPEPPHAHAPRLCFSRFVTPHPTTKSGPLLQILLNGNNVAMLVPGGSPEDA